MPAAPGVRHDDWLDAEGPGDVLWRHHRIWSTGGDDGAAVEEDELIREPCRQLRVVDHADNYEIPRRREAGQLA